MWVIGSGKKSLVFITLWGSERLSKTGASGDTMKEGCAINQSLSALGMVIKDFDVLIYVYIMYIYYVYTVYSH